VSDRLRRFDVHDTDVDGVVVVGPDGDLLADVSLFDMATAPAVVSVGSLAFDALFDHVHLDEPIEQTIWKLLGSQRYSLVVVDDDGRPVGRILAVDLVWRWTSSTTSDDGGDRWRVTEDSAMRAVASR